MSDEKKLTVFVDTVGRTVVGESLEETAKVLTVKNPAIVHVQPNPQTGQISVQLIPFFFKEFLKDQTKGDTVWEFLKSNMTVAKDIELDDRLVTQYSNMYSVIQSPGAGVVTSDVDTPGKDAPVIKLFD
jgi:hypothetical protein|tara:strand:+ start:693 stop:1079 length:387 start_codon:yes stop_codon:yes gene_type:complete